MDNIIAILLTCLLYSIFFNIKVSFMFELLVVLLLIRMILKREFKSLIIISIVGILSLYNYNISSEYFYIGLDNLNKNGSFGYVVRLIGFVAIIFNFSKKKTIYSIYNEFRKYKKAIFLGVILSEIITVYLIITGGGNIYRWGMNAFSGTYLTPHPYGYSLIVLSLIIEWLVVENNNFKLNVLYLIPIVACFMTGARAPLFALIIIIFILKTFNVREKVKEGFTLVQFMGISIFFMLVLANISNIINAILNSNIADKIISTIDKGNISNSRDLIWGGIISAFNNEFTLNEKLFGHGINYTSLINYNNINSAIWGHSDFVDILVSFGMITLILYCAIYIYYFYKLNKIVHKKLLSLGLFFSLLFLSVSNGVINYVQFIPIFCYMSLFVGCVSAEEEVKSSHV